jgi:hypothetical protein
MNKYRLPRVITLDYKKWRCGGNGPYKVGVGTTCLHNSSEKECCLGQFSRQAGASIAEISNYLEPEDCVDIVGLTNRFCNRAIEINDAESIDTVTRVKRLRSLCSKYRRKLVLKNFPAKLLQEINGDKKSA